jgi:hypothetical protein
VVIGVMPASFTTARRAQILDTAPAGDVSQQRDGDSLLRVVARLQRESRSRRRETSLRRSTGASTSRSRRTPAAGRPSS